MNNEEVFKVFLKRNKKLVKTRKYIKNIPYIVNSIPFKVEAALTLGFKWSKTEEKSIYWNKLDIEWNKLCKKLGLKGYIDLNKI